MKNLTTEKQRQYLTSIQLKLGLPVHVPKKGKSASKTIKSLLKKVETKPTK
jgi:hypothetical protein